MKLFASVTIALLFATAALAQEDGGDSGVGDGGLFEEGMDRPMLPCKKHGREIVEIMRKTQQGIKEVFELGIRYSDDDEESNEIKMIMKSMRGFIRKVQNMKRKIKKFKRNDPSPCKGFVKLTIDEMMDDAGEFRKVNFTREKSHPDTKCRPGDTWMKLNFTTESEEDDVKRILRHHKRVGACNNDIADIAEIEDDRKEKNSETELKFNLTLGGNCSQETGFASRKVKVWTRECKDENDQPFRIYKVDAFNEMCEAADEDSCELEKIMMDRPEGEDEEGSGEGGVKEGGAGEGGVPEGP